MNIIEMNDSSYFNLSEPSSAYQAYLALVSSVVFMGKVLYPTTFRVICYY